MQRASFSGRLPRRGSSFAVYTASRMRHATPQKTSFDLHPICSEYRHKIFMARGRRVYIASHNGYEETANCADVSDNLSYFYVEIHTRATFGARRRVIDFVVVICQSASTTLTVQATENTRGVPSIMRSKKVRGHRRRAVIKKK